MTSSKCVLQQRHLLGYESEPEPWTLALTLELTLTLFLTLTRTKFLKENKNDTGI